jgi:leucyl/phenylalanyl-tRNA--protein transferase
MSPMSLPASPAAWVASRPGAAEYSSLFADYAEAPAPSPRDRRTYRSDLFHETPLSWAKRIAGGALSALRHGGVSGCLAALDMVVRARSIDAEGLPEPQMALSHPDGLCGLARDLSPDALMSAFERGLYLAGQFGPLRWQAPSMRAVVQTAEFAENGVREPKIRFSFDHAFELALTPEYGAPPMPPKLKHAYCALHDAGYAHSFSGYTQAGEWIGGGFGVAVGDVFVFCALRVVDPTAQGAFLNALANKLNSLGYPLLDARRPNTHTEALGFKPMARDDYNARVQAGLLREKIGNWRNHEEAPKAAAA